MYAPGRYRVRLESRGGVVEREQDVPGTGTATLTVDATGLL